MKKMNKFQFSFILSITFVFHLYLLVFVVRLSQHRMNELIELPEKNNSDDALIANAINAFMEPVLIEEEPEEIISDENKQEELKDKKAPPEKNIPVEEKVLLAKAKPPKPKPPRRSAKEKSENPLKPKKIPASSDRKRVPKVDKKEERDKDVTPTPSQAPFKVATGKVTQEGSLLGESKPKDKRFSQKDGERLVQQEPNTNSSASANDDRQIVQSLPRKTGATANPEEMIKKDEKGNQQVPSATKEPAVEYAGSELNRTGLDSLAGQAQQTAKQEKSNSSNLNKTEVTGKNQSTVATNGQSTKNSTETPKQWGATLSQGQSAGNPNQMSSGKGRKGKQGRQKSYTKEEGIKAPAIEMEYKMDRRILIENLNFKIVAFSESVKMEIYEVNPYTQKWEKLSRNEVVYSNRGLSIKLKDYPQLLPAAEQLARATDVPLSEISFIYLVPQAIDALILDEQLQAFHKQYPQSDPRDFATLLVCDFADNRFLVKVTSIYRKESK